jgi:hypothetical protein
MTPPRVTTKGGAAGAGTGRDCRAPLLRGGAILFLTAVIALVAFVDGSVITKTAVYTAVLSLVCVPMSCLSRLKTCQQATGHAYRLNWFDVQVGCYALFARASCAWRAVAAAALVQACVTGPVRAFVLRHWPLPDETHDLTHFVRIEILVAVMVSTAVATIPANLYESWRVWLETAEFPVRETGGPGTEPWVALRGVSYLVCRNLILCYLQLIFALLHLHGEASKQESPDRLQRIFVWSVLGALIGAIVSHPFDTLYTRAHEQPLTNSGMLITPPVMAKERECCRWTVELWNGLLARALTIVTTTIMQFTLAPFVGRACGLPAAAWVAWPLQLPPIHENWHRFTVPPTAE